MGKIVGFYTDDKRRVRPISEKLATDYRCHKSKKTSASKESGEKRLC